MEALLGHPRASRTMNTGQTGMYSIHGRTVDPVSSLCPDVIRPTTTEWNQWVAVPAVHQKIPSW